MKTKIITLFALSVLHLSNGFSQELKPTALVLDFQTEGLFATPSLASSIVRIELDKTKKYSLYDKADVVDKNSGNSLFLQSCYSSACVISAGKLMQSDKVFSGSMLMLGNKIVITIKMYDVKTEQIEKTQVDEFVFLESELQNMVNITLTKMFDGVPDKNLVEKLAFIQNTSEIPTTKINNNGPRMGMAYMGGHLGDRYTADETVGGYGSSHIISQIGYQLEAQYLSAGNLQALGEFIFMVGGLDQQIFIPSIIIMNGFRLKNSGWEIAFGPSFGITKVALGYYDENKIWHLKNEFQGELDPITQTYSQNPYTLRYDIDKRGVAKFTSSWVWGFGKTFRSGYLNIPVNVYLSKNKNGWFTGISCGFNIRKKEQKIRVSH